MEPLLLEVKELLDSVQARWAICGGYALELFLDREIRRRHSDIDICVFEQDRERLWRHLHKAGWSVYEFQGMGVLRSIYPTGAQSQPGRNLMCVKGDCDLVRILPYGDGDERFYYEFDHRGIWELNYMDLLFNREEDGWFVGPAGIRREMDKALLVRDGVPYLAPEVVLRFKADRIEFGNHRTDWEAVYPYLSEEQKQWLSAQAAGADTRT